MSQPFDWSLYVSIKGYEKHAEFAESLRKALNVYSCHADNQKIMLQSFKKHREVTIAQPLFGASVPAWIDGKTLYLSPDIVNYGYRTSSGDIQQFDLVRLLSHEFKHFATDHRLDNSLKHPSGKQIQTVPSFIELQVTLDTDRDMKKQCDLPPRTTNRNFVRVDPASGATMKGTLVPDCGCDAIMSGETPRKDSGTLPPQDLPKRQDSTPPNLRK